MKLHIVLILLLALSLLPASVTERFDGTPQSIRGSISLSRQAPVAQDQILDEEGIDSVTAFSRTFALPVQDVTLSVHSITWNVFDSQGNFLYQQSNRDQNSVVVANRFQFREMRGFTITAKTQLADGDLMLGLAELDFSLSGQGSIPLPSSVSPAFIDAYKALADNWDTCYLRDLPVARPKMLIISHPNLANYQTDFINWKRALGYDVMVVNRVDIGSSVNEIKSYLVNHYQQHHCDYLLLLGDVSGSYSIPTAFFPSPEYAENDADDHQYTLIEGDDYFPEMLVGRFSFNDIAEFMTMANKTVVYEKTPFMGNTNWMTRSLAVAGNYAEGGLRPTTPVHMSRWLRDKMLTHGYAQVDTVFYPPTYPGTTSILSSINQGVQFISYRGWGDANGWHYPSFHNPDLNSVLSYQRMPIVFSIVCNTGDFANSVNPCFGEKWMRMGSVSQPNGCIAFVGPSDLHTKTRLNNSISSGAFRSILDNGVRGFGSSVLIGKIELYKNFPNDLAPDQYVAFYYHVYNLLSDPSLNMWVLVPQTISQDLLPAEYLASDSHISFSAAHLNGAIVSGTKNNTAFTYARVVDGVAYLPINPEEEGDLTITVSKPNFVPLVKTVTRVGDLGIGIIDNSVLDTFLNPNQTVSGTIALRNYGSSEVVITNAVIGGSDKVSVNYTHSQFSILPGAIAQISFQLIGSANIIPREALTLNLQINSLPPKYFRLWGGGAEFTVVSTTGTYPIGQTSQVGFTIMNTSGASLTNASVQVVSLTEAATFPAAPITLGSIGAGESKTFNASITVGTNAWNGRHLPLKLIVTDAGYSTQTFYSLTAGIAATTSPTGPCTYGYYAYDSFDLGFPSTPVYDWVEIDPLLGGNATVFLNQDDGSRVVDLPFVFRFYGRDYDQITICSNGWISMGATDMFDFYNHYIPAALGPYSMIAGYWDDLKGEQTGVDGEGNPVFADMRMLYWHDVANNRYIVQWNDAYNQYNLTSLEKFQIILYPRAGMDGDIVVQYHTIDNPGMTTNYCTVGIENHNQLVGLTYTHGNVYPPTATPLQAGLAVRFTTTAPDTYVSNDDSVQSPVISLAQNFPNPFNPSTTISFELKRPSPASLSIYNMKGQLVRNLVNTDLNAGKHSFVWNGTNDNGQAVASGLYLYRLHADGYRAERKMLLMK